MYLTTDIYSMFNHTHCYGRAGDEVREIGNRDDVKIVEGKDGKRFPVRVECLSDVKPEIEKQQPAPQPTKQQPVAKRKASAAKPTTLF